MNEMNDDEKICPFCGETIKLIAIRCKHCNAELTSNIPVNFSNESTKNLTNELMDSYKTMPQGYMVATVLLPILGTIFILFISDTFAGNKYSSDEIYNSNNWFFLFAFLNGFFCFVDANKLERQGINMKYSQILGFILVPIYIYIRGTKVNHHFKLGWVKSQIIFIAWVVSYLISIPFEYYLINLFYS